MKITKEIKVALLVLSGIALFIFGFNYLKGQNLLDSSRTYFIAYKNVEGITTSTPVTINGMPVGKVLEVSLKNDGSGQPIVKIIVNNDFEFSKNSTAQLYETGLIGGKAIAIIPAFDGAENAKDGIYLDGVVKAGLTELVNQRLTPLQEKLELVLKSTDVFLNNINDVFDAKTKQNLKSSIAGLSEAVNSFKETSNTLNNTVKSNEKNIDNVLSNANTITKNLSNITKEIDEAELGKTINQLETTLKNLDGLLADINSGKGTLGKLSKDEALYNNLKEASKEMEELIRDIKLHPKRYFRILSKKEIPYSKSESK